MVTACSKDEDNSSTPPEPARRTVIIYMSGENNLTYYIQSDLNEMMEGRKQVTANENLVVFVDKASISEKPYIAKIDENGVMEKLYEYMEKQLDSISSHFVVSSTSTRFGKWISSFVTLFPAVSTI